MITKDLFSLDEAIDIGRAAIVCKKNKQYNLAKMYFIEAGEKLSKLCRGNFIFCANLKNREKNTKRKRR